MGKEYYEKPYEVRQILPKSRRMIWHLKMDLMSDAKRHFKNTYGGIVQLLFHNRIVKETRSLVPPCLIGPCGPHTFRHPDSWKNVEYSELWQKRFNPDNEPMRFPKPRNVVYRMQKMANIRQRINEKGVIE